MTEPASNIKGVFGEEPRRENEYPLAHVVGYNGVTRITESTQNLGDYGILWYHIWQGDFELARMNAKHVTSIVFFPPVPEGGAA